RWGVDGLDSAFAFVMRAVLEEAGYSSDVENLVPVGGTLQRYNALIEGTIDGTTLHPPFDHMADDAGFHMLGRHVDVLPDLITVVLIAPRAEVSSDSLLKYLDVTDRARAQLLASGPSAVADILARKGW